MHESGWLTRSLEQVAPFDLKFPGKIRNQSVKSAFLLILDDVQTHEADARAYLVVLLWSLLRHTRIAEETVAGMYPTPAIISVEFIVKLLYQHFFATYPVSGASRLPVIALYTIYQLLMRTPRYQDKQLLALKGHTTADRKAHSIGDIEIIDSTTGTFYEAVEVKHNKPISLDLIETVFDKISTLSVSRYYVLTTAEPNILVIQEEEIERRIVELRTLTGCEIILNGVIPSVKYYLQLLPDTSTFMEGYTSNLQADYAAGTDIKLVHIEHWYTLLQSTAGLNA